MATGTHKKIKQGDKVEILHPAFPGKFRVVTVDEREITATHKVYGLVTVSLDMVKR